MASPRADRPRACGGCPGRLASLGLLLAMGLGACAPHTAYVGRRRATETPWLLPAAERGSQRLFRARLEAPEGKGRFRLLLRLRRPERYQLRATHPLFNRRLWSLDVKGETAVLVDYHQKLYCRYRGEAEIEAIPMGPFPFASLPALLLGYLPVPPTGAVGKSAAGIVYRDSRGRRWEANLENGLVLEWTVRQEETAPVEWEKAEEWVILQAPAEGIRLRWRETLREAWSGELARLEIPQRYRETECDLGWIRAVQDAPWEEGDKND